MTVLINIWREVHMLRIRGLMASFLLIAVVVTMKQTSEAQQGVPPPLPEAVFAERQGISPPLHSIPSIRPILSLNKTVSRHIPWDRIGGNRPTISVPDPLRQISGATTSTNSATPNAANNFEGLSDDDNAAALGFRVVPPDTEGDIGPNHYVQMINLTFAIYDKSGNLLVGPLPNNVLWSGSKGPCEDNNDGDPIVLYDHLADRWVISQFALQRSRNPNNSTINGYQCFAISTTSDPTGSYYLYAFLVSPDGINDYPKLGVWHDGYYYTANEFTSAGQFRSAVAVVFEREAMLAGETARGVKFGQIPCLLLSTCFSLQPSHLEGPAPPTGTPNTFVMAYDAQTWGFGLFPDGYQLWDFSANWQDPSSSTFALLGLQTNTPFDAELCNYSRACIPQPSPGEALDPLGHFTMYRAQYRQFGTEGRMVLNHTVDVGGDTAGIRWTELRRNTGSVWTPGSLWTLHQEGTYAPSDGLHRWMGSIAMDQAGNIALGYSVSGTNSYPSIAYNSRAAGDPLGTLAGGEVTLVSGTDVQTDSANRWGDYSSMSVDPVDGCTFWYTQEYQANDDSRTDFDFKTRIGSFKLEGCGGPVTPVTDIAITSVAPTPSTVVQGESVSVDVTVSNVGNQDVSTGITVSLAESPDGYTFPDQVIVGGLTAGTSTVLTFDWTTTTSTSEGSHTLTASHGSADDDAANNSNSTTAAVEAAVTDVEITSVVAPSSVTQGDVVNVDVTVTNVGNQDVSTFDVTLNDDTDGVLIDTQTIIGGLAAGAATTLNFSWDTGTASLAPHTLTASHDSADDNAANNSNNTTVTVNDASSIMLDVSGTKSKGMKTAELLWTGTVSGSVDIYRNGAFLLGNVTDTGSYTDEIGKGGGKSTFTYQVCEGGTSTCSNVAAVTI